MNKKLILITFSLIMILTIITLIKTPAIKVINCSLINYSKEFEEITYNVFVQKGTDEISKEDIFKYIEEAKNRVRELYGNLTVSPTYIIATDEKLLKKYNGNNIGLTHNSILGIYIVIGPKGMNSDVVSHELVHSELFNRVGLTKSFKIPKWFNEGLATQADYRERYSVDAWNEITSNGSEIRDVKLLESSKQFYISDNDTRRNNYILAKHEVKKWFAKVGTEGLIELINKFVGGDDLKTVYESML